MEDKTEKEIGTKLYHALRDCVTNAVLYECKDQKMAHVIKIGIVTLMADFCYGTLGVQKGKELVNEYCKSAHGLIDYLDEIGRTIHNDE